MYIFEFTHTFDQDDLAHMWQNLPPKVGRQTLKAKSSISHDLLADALMGSAITQDGTRMRNEIQWMVFKVKQRAESDYFKVVSKTTPVISEPESNLKRRRGQAPNQSRNQIRFEHETNDSIPQYSYNWPYDFFSLVEFADLSAEVTFTTPEVEDDLREKSDQIPQTPARDPDVGTSKQDDSNSQNRDRGTRRNRRRRAGRQLKPEEEATFNQTDVITITPGANTDGEN